MGSAGSATILFMWLLAGSIAIGGVILALKGNFKKPAKAIIIIVSLLAPIAIYVRLESIRKSEELQYIGVYQLMNYPNCYDCVLELKEDNSYVLSDGATNLRSGEWEYVHSGDYWAVEIDKHERLGSGDFEYFE